MRRTLLALIALLACLGLVAGCGTSGGDATAPTTTKAADDGAGTTEPSDDSDTTEPTDTTEPSDDASVAVADLEALLPTEEEVGPDYTLDSSSADGTDDSGDDETDSTDEQFKEACPGLEQLDFLDSAADAGDESAMVSFVTEDDREIEVELDPTSEDFTEDNLDQLVEAFSGCEDIEITDEDGISYTISITAEPDGSRGDFGLRVDMDIAIDFMGTPVTFQFAGQAFKIGDVGVFVSATSGLEETETDFTPVPLDEEILSDLSDLMENRVNDL